MKTSKQRGNTRVKTILLKLLPMIKAASADNKKPWKLSDTLMKIHTMLCSFISSFHYYSPNMNNKQSTYAKGNVNHMHHLIKIKFLKYICLVTACCPTLRKFHIIAFYCTDLNLMLSDWYWNSFLHMTKQGSQMERKHFR